MFCTNLCKTAIVIVYFVKIIGIVLVIFAVAPFTGAWIEMCMVQRCIHRVAVAPFTGAWIEIRIAELVPLS